MLSEQDIQKLRDIRISNILGLSVVRNKTVIRCPSKFHNDRTASFLLDKDNGYYCFGCGIKGKGAIDFTMDVLGVDFKTALQELISVL